jgi:hypothetical protein
MRLLFAMLILLSPCALIAGTPSVVLGKASEQFLIDAEAPCDRGGGDLLEICMDSWIGWRITVQKTLSGNPIHGRIRAAWIRHAPFIKTYLSRFRLFVLEPIESTEMRKLLGVDYLLRDVSMTHDMYCTSESPAKYGLADDDMDVYALQAANGSRYCFALPAERK